jgi:hypothetical protein
VTAFFKGKKAKAGYTARGARYTTDGVTLRIWGNVVASKEGDEVHIGDAQWRSVITKQMLNAILLEAHRRSPMQGFRQIHQKRHVWYVGDQRWMGGATIDMRTGSVALHDGRHPYVVPAREEIREMERRERGHPRLTQTSLFDENRRYRRNLHTKRERGGAVRLIGSWLRRGLRAAKKKDRPGTARAYGALEAIRTVALAERPRATLVARIAQEAMSAVRRAFRGKR